MYFGDLFLTRGRLPLSSFLCFVGGFSMGSWLTLFHQLQAEKDLIGSDMKLSSPNDPDPLLFLTVLIISAPSNARRRAVIRSTWLKLGQSSPRLRHFFLVGSKGLSSELRQELNEEADREEDLIILHDLVDSFQNLSDKVVKGISLVSKNFPSLYTLKCDDDSFVRLDKIFKELDSREETISDIGSTLTRKPCFYWGFFDGRAPIQRKGKWKEHDPYVLCDTYLPYALGGGYIISKTCGDFIRNNKHMLKSYNNEDVTIGTWLSMLSLERK